MPTTIHSGTAIGVQGVVASVTCELGGGKLPDFQVVGLQELALRESRVRIRSAIRHSGFKFPDGQVLVTVDAGIQGALAFPTGFDLPIAVAVLVASGQAPTPWRDGICFIGELSLTGAVRPVGGAEAVALAMPEQCYVVAAEQAHAVEALCDLPNGAWAVHTLQDAVTVLKGEAHGGSLPPLPEPAYKHSLCWSDVRGHAYAKRALEIAAAGGHNAVLLGSPGTGKTMLSRRLPTILPPLSETEAKELTALFSVAGLLPNGTGLISQRPFRAPHHTASAAALVGGGSVPRPGEVSLAHRGVLFLDELPEFARHVIEALRQPLEDGYVTVTRARQAARFPAQAQVVAALNPCPCGLLGDNTGRCQCSPLALKRYQERLSKPLLDGFDIQVRLPPTPPNLMRDSIPGDTSATVQARVVAARARQTARYGTEGATNASVAMTEVRKKLPLLLAVHDLLLRAMDTYQLSPRAHDKVWRVAATIADLDGAECIGAEHLGEALQYRYFDRPQEDK